MNLAQHRVQGASPALIQLTEAAIAVTLRLHLAVFLPQQQQGHRLSTEFFMDVRPVGQSRTTVCSRNRLSDQQLEQLLFTLALRHRPAYSGNLRPLEVIAIRAGWHTSTARTFPDG